MLNSEDKLLFQELWEHNKQNMYRVAYQILQDSGLAEDAVQEAFFKLVENFSDYQKDDKEKLNHLCLMITKRKALNIQKSRTHLPMLSLNDDLLDIKLSSFSESPEEQILKKETQTEFSSILMRILSTLPKREYNALLLRHYYNLKSRQIAELLDMKEKSVNVLLHRTYQKLKKEFKKEQKNNS